MRSRASTESLGRTAVLSPPRVDEDQLLPAPLHVDEAGSHEPHPLHLYLPL